MSSRLFDLSGRLALVTGSSKGIGRAVARGLAEAGAAIVLNARTEESIAPAAAELAAAGHQVHAVPFDVTDRAAVAAAVARIEDGIGPIDILVNNAGMQFRSPLEEFPEDAWHRLIATNLDSVFFVGQAVARRMIPRRRGKIVNVCSVNSELARQTIAPYSATKGAVKMLTRGMSADWARHGIQVNGLAPGYFKTELNKALAENEAFNDFVCKRTPAGRWGEVEELVGAAVFLASDASSYVNGHVLLVDGGMSGVV